MDRRNITSTGSCTREGEKGDSLTFSSLISEPETLDSVQRNMYTTQFDNELDASNLTCQSINISNREVETNITLHDDITSTIQHGSIDGSDTSPLHCIANIKGFKIACININSLYKHIDEIRFILMSSPLDVLAINESKLDHSITEGEIHIPGHDIIRKDRNRHGGGVALYIKNTLSFSVRQEFVPARLEIVCVEINLPYSTSFLVCIRYRPPSANVDLFDDYSKFLEKCDLMNKQLKNLNFCHLCINYNSLFLSLHA